MQRMEEEIQQRRGDPTESTPFLSGAEGWADLHTHTTHSDGALTTRELLTRARDKGLQALAITDHDNVAAVVEAIELGTQYGIQIISGVELSVTMEEKDIHVLAYCFDHTKPELLDYLRFFREERVHRAERMVRKLNNINIPLKMESVLEQAGIGSVGRPHIANALVESGWTGSYHEAFEKYIGMGGPAFEK
ncbi:MAG: PHP domain-containing protein, partial [Bacteroidota bacterium]